MTYYTNITNSRKKQLSWGLPLRLSTKDKISLRSSKLVSTSTSLSSKNMLTEWRYTLVRLHLVFLTNSALSTSVRAQPHHCHWTKCRCSSDHTSYCFLLSEAVCLHTKSFGYACEKRKWNPLSYKPLYLKMRIVQLSYCFACTTTFDHNLYLARDGTTTLVVPL